MATPLDLPSLLLLCPVTLVLGVMAATVAIPKPPLLLLCPGTLMLGVLAATVCLLLLLCVVPLVLVACWQRT